MNVFIFAIVLDSREIEVDDMHHIADIETTSGNTSCDEDRTLAATEGAPRRCVSTNEKQRIQSLHSILTLSLSAIGVDRGRRHVEVEQVVIDEVGSLLGTNENQGARRRHGDQKVVKSLLFHVWLDPENLRRC